MNADEIVTKGRQCLEIEIEALEATRGDLDESFARIVGSMNGCLERGRKIVLTGVGKSAHIARKLVATFNSITVRSTFLDATQALHGDLGICLEKDLALLLSNSGETEELVRLVPILKRLGLSTVAVTGDPGSTLAAICDDALVFRVPREACPLKLAPTSSTTVSLALGDALAMVLLEIRGFTKQDFARVHPAGTLGQSLLLKVADIMRTGKRFPVLHETVPTRDAILAMTRAKSGSLALISPSTSKLSGIFTDGDFRRAALEQTDCLEQPVSAFMTRHPKTISSEALAVDALEIFEKHNIDDLIVVNADHTPVGLIDNQDLPKLRII